MWQDMRGWWHGERTMGGSDSREYGSAVVIWEENKDGGNAV